MTVPSQGKIRPSNAPNDRMLPIEPSVLQGMLDSSIITVDEELTEGPKCIEIINGDNPFTVGTLGDFSLVIGKAKQGKTFVISMVLAAAETGMPFSEVIKVNLPAEQRKIILFDTEQSRYHVQKVLKRICKLVGKPVPENLTVYSLRRNTPAERLQIIEHALQHIPNIGLVIIDGIRDLVTGINDEDQATLITSKLMKFSDEINIHIVTVLHMNKGDTNARGHLGTELTNKAQTVISVTKSTDDKNVAVVKAEYGRDKEFEPWAFKINDDGLPYICELTNSKSKEVPIMPDQLSLKDHLELLTFVFEAYPKPKGGIFKNALHVAINNRVGKSGVTKAVMKCFFDYYIEKNIIYSEGKVPHNTINLTQKLLITPTD